MALKLAFAVATLLLWGHVTNSVAAWMPAPLFTPRSTAATVGGVERISSSALGMSRTTATRPPSWGPRQDEMLAKTGEFFELNRFAGKVSFGSCANLVTRLGGTATPTTTEAVTEWLSNDRQIALSIWEESMIDDLGSGKYKLRLMSLQFVTIQLSPWVDVYMWTDMDPSGTPCFRLQSIKFDPNVRLLPGIGVSAESLGITIEVAGELRPTANGGVSGKIGFRSGGLLPPPFRILPEAALRVASDTINKTVTDFCVQSFQSGARRNFAQFMADRRKEAITPK